MKPMLLATAFALTTAPAMAEDYEWYGHQHACVVETARVVIIDDDRYTNWKNAPKSFFLNLQACKDYAKAMGVVYGAEPDSEDPTVFYPVRECWLWEQGHMFPAYVATVKGMDFGVLPTVAKSYEPISNENSTMVLQDDGYIDHSELSVTDKAGKGWFLFRANCTQLPE